MKKSIKAFALLFAFLTIAITTLCITSFAAEETIDVTIVKNVAVTDKIQAMYAVPVADGVTANNTVLNVYDKNPNEEGAQLVWSGKGIKTTIAMFDNKDFIVFNTNRVALYELATVYYLQLDIDGVESQVESYSVAEYLFERLYKDDFVNKTSADGQDYYRKTFYEGLVKTARGAYETLTHDAPKSIEDYVYVYIKEGTLADGRDSAMLEKGTEVTLTHTNGATKWDVVSYDVENNATTSSASESTFTLNASTVFSAPDPYVFTFDEGYNNKTLYNGSELDCFIVTNSSSANKVEFKDGAMHLITTDAVGSFRAQRPMLENNSGATKFVMEGDFTFNILDEDLHGSSGSPYFEMYVGNSINSASANANNRLIFYVEDGDKNRIRIGNTANYIIGEPGEKLHIRYEITAGNASTSTPCNYKITVNGVEIYNGNSHSGSYTAGIGSFGNYYAFEFVPKGTPNCEIVIDNLKFSKE